MVQNADITDTIAAIATPPGKGGIGVIRISGPATCEIAVAILGKQPALRQACLVKFKDADGTTLDQGIALLFAAPASYTGEDVLELQGHGGPMVLDALLQRVLDLGARLARPGEFSERAFLNNKLDLAQAEAVADLIDAGSRQAASAAMRSLEGEFSQQVRNLTQALLELRIYVEAAIDFAEEEIDYLADGVVLARVDDLRSRLQTLLGQSRSGVVLREGLRVVIAGQPNVGKSSLLNRLAGRDTAIVTAYPGTTRDVLREYISLDGLPLHIVDTAGLRESDDPIETEGVRRAHVEMTSADRVLLVVDDTRGAGAAERALLAGLAPEQPVSLLFNKCDLSGRVPAEFEQDGYPSLRISATSGAGMDLLVAHLQVAAGFQAPEAGGFTARRRHLAALDMALAAVDRGREHLTGAAAGELLAEELRLAQKALGEITGEFSSEDLLGRIFSSFCIGK